LFGFLFSSLWFGLLLFWSLGFFFELFQSVHGDLGCGGDAGGELISSSGECDLATLAFPNTT